MTGVKNMTGFSKDSLNTVFFIALMVLSVMISATHVSAQDDAQLQVISKEGIGNYLADQDGRTLYWHKFDSPGTSTCMDECILMWPPFYRARIVPPEGANAEDFRSMIRKDGKSQTTFKGYPLYYFSLDQEQGDVKGYNFGYEWFTVNPAKFPFIPLYPHVPPPQPLPGPHPKP